MKNIFSRINRFRDIEFNEGERFKFTLQSVREKDIYENIEVVNSNGNSAVMKIGYTYRIKVKKYMTEKSTLSFDFMHRFNNDVPMPIVEMVGDVIGETRGMLKMKLHSDLRENVTWEGWVIKSAIKEFENIS